MSDDEKLTPETPSRHTRMEHEARLLEEGLRETADKLGLKIAVRCDVVNWCFRFFARPKIEPVVHDIDEDFLVRQHLGSATAVADLVSRVLEELQLALHQKLAALMSSTNVREQQFGLTREDKRVLHEMFMDASENRSRDYNRAEANMKKVDEYQALMNRLCR